MALNRRVLKIGESIVAVISEGRFIRVAEKEIVRQRRLLEDYIRMDPAFLFTLKPHRVLEDAPEIAKKMAEASRVVGVGPMAAVAGTIAEYALKAMIKAGARHAIVDNGGDIALFVESPVTVGIYTGVENTSGFGFRIYPAGKIIGICTSSGTIGHSLSFGKANVATVISEDVSLADAAATALGNLITDEDEDLIKEAMASLFIPGIEGMLVIIGKLIGMSGELPELVRTNVDFSLITRG